MEKRTLLTDGGPVNYWVSHVEGAPALVLLHGLTTDHTMFDKQVEAFEGQYTLLLWDAPAHGDSRPYRDPSYENGAEELKAILDAEGIAKAILVGQSMGGYHIQSFLSVYPDMSAGFIGIDTCPYGERYYSKSDRWWLKQIEWMSMCYPYKLLVNSVARTVGTTEPTRENMRRALLKYNKRELCHLMGLGYAGFLSANRDMVIPCPTVLIVGERDITGKVRQYCNMWHEATGYPLRVVPNAAHNANFDAPDAVNRIIDAFIATLSL